MDFIWRKVRLGVPMAIVVWLCIGSFDFAFAQATQISRSGGDAKKKFVLKAPEKPRVINATVIGENFCAACEVGDNYKAGSDCKKFGHLMALRVRMLLDSTGKETTFLRDRTLHYLPNDESARLVNEYPTGLLSVRGLVYTREYLLEVKAFEPATDEMKAKVNQKGD